MDKRILTGEYMAALSMQGRAKVMLDVVRVLDDPDVLRCFLNCMIGDEWDYKVVISAVEFISNGASLEDMSGFIKSMIDNKGADILRWVSNSRGRMLELDTYFRKSDGAELIDILQGMQINAAEAIYVRVWKALEKFNQ